MRKPYRSESPRREDFQSALRSLDTYIDITVDDLIDLNQRARQIASRRAAENLRVAQVMSRSVHTVHPETPLSEAAHLMVGERISGLPVVDADGCLTGLITEADFLRALGVREQQSSPSLWQTLESLFTHLAHHTDLNPPDDPVSAHMAQNVVCVRPDQDVHHVLELMKKHMVKRVVVCDEKHRVLGIVTRSDLVRVFFDRFI